MIIIKFIVGREKDEINTQYQEKILEQNEGFTTRKSYNLRNFKYQRIYTISCGQLKISEVGKTSWADSRYDDEWIADDKETHRFLYDNLGLLNLDGIE